MHEATSDETRSRDIRVLRNYRLGLWLILASLFALDIVTTTINLEQGNAEINPVMIPFAHNPLLHGIVKMGAFVFLFGVIETAVRFIREKEPEKMPFWIRLNYGTLYSLILFALISLICLYLFTLMNNMQVIL